MFQYVDDRVALNATMILLTMYLHVYIHVVLNGERYCNLVYICAYGQGSYKKGFKV